MPRPKASFEFYLRPLSATSCTTYNLFLVCPAINDSLIFITPYVGYVRFRIKSVGVGGWMVCCVLAFTGRFDQQGDVGGGRRYPLYHLLCRYFDSYIRFTEIGEWIVVCSLHVFL